MERINMDTIRNPKYDNDYITKGYLDKQLSDEKDNVDKTIKKLPKSYSSPPLTPYYKGSLLNYNGKLYKCIKDKLVGEFSFNDWQIIATDDTSINNFIKNTYSVDKLELEKQIDDKVESWYQEDDPEQNWSTDILKAKHVGDYWYDTSTNNQFRYSKMPTNPITYKWLKVDVPMAIYDQINTKKSIYTSKPSSYKKDDLWIIEDSISDNDLPIGESDNPIAKGDWVFAIQDSDSYNKEHWVKRDMDVSLDYLQTHYYTKETIDETYSTKTEVSSDIKKAKDEIELNVKNEYSTKKEITEIVKDYDEKIGAINTTIETQGTTLSDLSVENGQIKQSVSNISTEIETVKSNVDTTIKSTVKEYKIQGTDNWSETFPTREEGQIILVRDKYVHMDDSITYSSEAQLTGDKGDRGLQGEKGNQGPQGEQGVPGDSGADGKTTYLHIKYSEDGETFTPASDDYAIGEKPSAWIGQYTDYNENDSTTFSDYNWYKFTEDIDPKLGDLQSQINNNKNEINENYQETNKKITTTNEQVAQITTRIDDVNISVSNLTTKTQEIDGNIEEIEQKLDDMSYDFTTAGLKVGKSTDDNNTVLDNNGIRSYNKTELNAIFNKNGSGVDKLIVTGTAQIGYLKIKKTIRNGKKRTSIYHLEELIENLTDLER